MLVSSRSSFFSGLWLIDWLTQIHFQVPSQKVIKPGDLIPKANVIAAVIKNITLKENKLLETFPVERIEQILNRVCKYCLLLIGVLLFLIFYNKQYPMKWHSCGLQRPFFPISFERKVISYFKCVRWCPKKASVPLGGNRSLLDYNRLKTSKLARKKKAQNATHSLWDTLKHTQKHFRWMCLPAMVSSTM